LQPHKSAGSSKSASLSLSSASTTIKLMVDLSPLVRRLYHSPKNEVSREGECMFPHLWGVGVDFAWLREKKSYWDGIGEVLHHKNPAKDSFFLIGMRKWDCWKCAKTK
jgi:hypothetical protein